MRKSLILLVVLVSSMQMLNAQWYYRSCGVKDLNNCTPEEFECMWNKANNIARTGAITTGVGAACYGIAAIIAISSIDNFTDTHLVSTIFFAYAGLTLIVVGAPIWITGGVRKAGLEKIPGWIHLRYSGISPSIGINPLNNSINYGMTVSFSF